MKCSYADNPQLSASVFGLLDVVFPGLRQAARDIRALGTSWESVSTPYILTEEDRVVAHVGVIELSLVVIGRSVSVGSVHAVATHPDRRRRGLFRQLMGEVLDDCANRYETLILTTDNPVYYKPFGFRDVGEHYFTTKIRSGGGVPGSRLLRPQDPNDLALLHRLLKTRAPISRTLGVLNDIAVFCFNEGKQPIHYIDELDVVVCLQIEGTQLRIFDVVGPDIPPLAALLAQIPQPVDEVVTYFAPEQMAVEATASAYVFDHGGPSYLLVRGPFAAEEVPFTLPRTART